jgi:S-adenosyl-L-methionine hydrolase (adenosine-forming)
MKSIITMITDFGLTDEYVGVMKGVILSHDPGIQIIDICHSLSPQSIEDAAYIIESTIAYFPDRTVHLVVVDPGVGSGRRIVICETAKQLFIGPDNGIFSLLLQNNLICTAYEVNNSDYFLDPVSNTFHGRDIMAPLAARIATGLNPAKAGVEITPESMFCIDLPQPVFDKDNNKISGQIISIDRFGNLTTNIHARDLKKLKGHLKKNTSAHKGISLAKTAKSPNSVIISMGNNHIPGPFEYYCQAEKNSGLAIIASRNYLEIAINQGSAAQFYNVEVGEKIIIDAIA